MQSVMALLIIDQPKRDVSFDLGPIWGFGAHFIWSLFGPFRNLIYCGPSMGQKLAAGSLLAAPGRTLPTLAAALQS